MLRGDRAERLPPKRVDYLLRYTDSLPIAVVEAKEEGKPAVKLAHPEADQFDLLANLAYGRPLRSRAERASEFRLREHAWLDAQAEEARAVILALVDKYVLGGLREMTDPAVFRVSPFREMGEARGVPLRFGGDAQRFRATMTELQRRLYAEAA